MLVDLGRVRARLAVVRLRYADLVAAGRATLFAHANGGHDLLAYLRDELPATGRAPARTTVWHW